MMKYAAIFLVALLGVANASLEDDIAEIKALIPVDDIKALTAEYAANDAQFRTAVAYLTSEEFRAIIATVANTSQSKDFIAYMKNAGLDFSGLVESIRKLLEISSYTVGSSARPSTRSFHGWMDAVMAMIPFTEIRALIVEKKETSEEFQEFWGHICGEEAQTLVATLAATPEWQSLLTKGRNHGVPVDAWLSIIYGIFGWSL